MKIALLGDSIFDNRTHVGDGVDVVSHLGEVLPTGVEVELLARDGSRIESVFSQLLEIRSGTTHVFISVGGNDVIDCLELFDRPVGTIGEALEQLGAAAARFRAAYRRMIHFASGHGRAVAVCTISYPAFTEPVLRERAVAALSHFNDGILFEAAASAVPVLDLRQVCDRPGHYASPIEPSDAGGRRIAEAVSTLLAQHRFTLGRCSIYT